VTPPRADLIAEVIAQFDHSSVVRLRNSDEPGLQLSPSTVSLLDATVQAAGLRASAHHDRGLADAVVALAQFISPLVKRSSVAVETGSGPILGPQAVAKLARLCQAAFVKVRAHPDYMLSDSIVQLVRCLEPIISKYRLESSIFLASRMPTRYDTATLMREVDDAIEGLRRLGEEDDPSRA
jgi:hypothetical protein